MKVTRLRGGFPSSRLSVTSRTRILGFGAKAVTAAAAGLAVVGFGAALAGASVSAPSGLAASCQPGSGPHLAGRTFTQISIGAYTADKLQCADLTGATLSGLSLVQADLTGAILKNAHLQGTELGQATLTGADLSGADLSNAKLGQAELGGANLTGADLQKADLTQATLTGANFTNANLAHATLDQAPATGAIFQGADLSGASLIQTDLTKANLDNTKLGGATFTQATLDHATFDGATGLPPWNLFILLGAGVVLILLVLMTVTKGVRSMAQNSLQPIRLVIALLGCAVAAIGLHLFAGGLLGTILSASGPPVAQMCKGPTCAVGLSSGFFGIFGGVIVLLIGLGMRASLRSRRYGMSAPPGMPGMGQMGVPEWKNF